MNILVYGAGVIGTLYAARLRGGGHRVTVLARGQRLADIRRHGLVLENILSGARSEAAVDTIERLRPDDQYDLALLTILGGLAEFERELIRARTGEGRARAMAAGVKFGRPPKLSPYQQREARARLEAGDSTADVARTYGSSPVTAWRLKRNVDGRRQRT